MDYIHCSTEDELKKSLNAIKHTGSETSTPSIVRQSSFDPKVSCPIVCGQYMRATGYFYRMNGVTYLVTARHNLLPTDAQVPNPNSSGSLWSVRTDYHLPIVDIYLSDSGKWEHERIDIREVPERYIISDPSVDVLAARIQFDPTEFGYTVFTQDNVTLATEEEESFVVYGFSTDSLPSRNDEYSIEGYKRRLGRPCEFNFKNISLDAKQLAKSTEKLHGMGLDLNAHPESAYNGLSGAPVLGQGLVGIHSGTDSGETLSQLYPEFDNVLRTHYYSMNILEAVLSEK